MTRSRFDRTTCHVPVKHTPPNSDDSVAVLHDLDSSIADPVSERPRTDSEHCGSLDDAEQLVCRHRDVLKRLCLLRSHRCVGPNVFLMSAPDAATMAASGRSFEATSLTQPR